MQRGAATPGGYDPTGLATPTVFGAIRIVVTEDL